MNIISQFIFLEGKKAWERAFPPPILDVSLNIPKMKRSYHKDSVGIGSVCNEELSPALLTSIETYV